MFYELKNVLDSYGFDYKISQKLDSEGKIIKGRRIVRGVFKKAH